jgi:hypothetical protein
VEQDIPENAVSRAPTEEPRGIELSTPRPIEPPPDRFEGLGRLRGSVQVRGGAAFPERWSLVLEPSAAVVTPSRAEHRRIDHAETNEFDVEDLPLGAYAVSVEAPGMNSVPRQVLLQKPVTDIFITITIHPAGFLTGSVSDSSGRPIADIEVLLERRDGGGLRSQRTDGGGSYLFENVLDGEYRLFVGNTTNPSVPPRELAFSAPSLHMPPIVLPPLGEIEICVRDGSGNPLEGVLLRGYGDEGGTIEAKTNRDGIAKASLLPPGFYTVIASSPALGEARGRCRLEPGGRERIELAPDR